MRADEKLEFFENIRKMQMKSERVSKGLETTSSTSVSHCVKSVQIRSCFWSAFSPNAGKYGPEITPYLGTFHAVSVLDNFKYKW